jgi:hypothetical protein
MAQVPITFSILSGGGALGTHGSTFTLPTNASGEVTAPFVTSTTPGTATVQAQASGATTPVTWSATGTPPPPLSIALSLPSATVGTAYTATATASGGTGGYVWILASGQLPPGITFSGGTFSGTPTAAGDSTFTIQVSDSSGNTAPANGTLAVAAPSNPPTNPGPGPGEVPDPGQLPPPPVWGLTISAVELNVGPPTSIGAYFESTAALYPQYLSPFGRMLYSRPSGWGANICQVADYTLEVAPGIFLYPGTIEITTPMQLVYETNMNGDYQITHEDWLPYNTDPEPAYSQIKAQGLDLFRSAYLAVTPGPFVPLGTSGYISGLVAHYTESNYSTDAAHDGNINVRKIRVRLHRQNESVTTTETRSKTFVAKASIYEEGTGTQNKVALITVHSNSNATFTPITGGAAFADFGFIANGDHSFSLDYADQSNSDRSVYLLPVEIEQKKINADGTVGDFESVTEIRPTRWFDAFNSNSFVGLAHDRDRVRIKLPNFLLSMSTPPPVMFGVTGITGTSTSETSDNPDKISLPAGELMDVNLVTDANDDDGYSVLGPEDGDWDTTHLSSLSASAKIEVHGLGANPISVEVPVMAPVGKVEIVVRVLSETGSLAPPELTDVMKDCLIAREIYAQLGVQVSAISIAGMPLNPTISNLIADGDLSFTDG